MPYTIKPDVDRDALLVLLYAALIVTHDAVVNLVPDSGSYLLTNRLAEALDEIGKHFDYKPDMSNETEESPHADAT